MADIKICPLCGAPLEEVGKRGLRLRCRNCRSVFDTAQLRQYYLDKGGVGSRIGVPDYETPHMHATETVKQRQQHAQEAAYAGNNGPGVRWEGNRPHVAGPTAAPVSADAPSAPGASPVLSDTAGAAVVPVAASSPSGPAEEPVVAKRRSPALIVVMLVALALAIWAVPNVIASIGNPPEPSVDTANVWRGTTEPAEVCDPSEMVIDAQYHLERGGSSGEQALVMDYAWMNTTGRERTFNESFYCLAYYGDDYLDSYYALFVPQERDRFLLVKPGEVAFTTLGFLLPDEIVDGEVHVCLDAFDTGGTPHWTDIDVAELRESAQSEG